MTTLQHKTTLLIELLAAEIEKRLKGTRAGHCARVNFLERDTALSVSQYLSQFPHADTLAVHILRPDGTGAGTPLTVSPLGIASSSPAFITTDRAIEIRNRKQERLCLFVPSDIKDAASSSIANSFALIDGRELY